MAEFPTYQEMGKKVAEEALDGYVYKGKTLREWVEIILSSSGNPNKCEDAISRRAAKRALEDRFMELQKRHSEDRYETNFCLNTILELPSVTPKATECEDAISRAEAIRIASGYCHWANIPDELAKLPSVTPKQKMGHWIMPVQDDGMSDPIYYQVRCSECGFDLDPQTWHMELHQYGADKYCPNCGAKMQEVDE